MKDDSPLQASGRTAPPAGSICKCSLMGSELMELRNPPHGSSDSQCWRLCECERGLLHE